jgi:hypothetical protein
VNATCSTAHFRTAGNCPESLIICGLQHIPDLHDLFAAEFEDVELIDLRREEWFLADWRS